MIAAASQPSAGPGWRRVPVLNRSASASNAAVSRCAPNNTSNRLFARLSPVSAAIVAASTGAAGGQTVCKAGASWASWLS